MIQYFAHDTIVVHITTIFMHVGSLHANIITYNYNFTNVAHPQRRSRRPLSQVHALCPYLTHPVGQNCPSLRRLTQPALQPLLKPLRCQLILYPPQSRQKKESHTPHGQGLGQTH